MQLFEGRFNDPGLYYVNVSWCGHCRRARPMMEQLSEELGSALPVYDVDGDMWGTLLKQRFGPNAPTSYPTILYVNRDGSTAQFEDERTPRNLRDFACSMSSRC